MTAHRAGRVAALAAVACAMAAAPAPALTWREVGPDLAAVDAVDGSPSAGLLAAGDGIVLRRAPAASRWSRCAALPADALPPQPDDDGLAVDPVSSRPLVVTAAGAVLLGTPACDGWRRLHLPRSHAVARAGSRLVLATDDGIRLSDDGGRTWRAGGAGLPVAPWGRRLAAAGDDVVTWTAEDGRLACSADGGATFRTTDLRGVDAAAADAGHVWASSDGALLGSVDGCATWHGAAPPPGSTGATVRGAAGGALFLADDAGRLWRRDGGGDVLVGGAAGATGVVAGPDGGAPVILGPHLARLTGTTGVRIDQGLGIYEAGMAVDASATARVLVVPTEIGLLVGLGTVEHALVSTDGGRTWAARAFPENTAATVLPRGTLEASRWPDPGFRSTDGAATWRRAAALPESVLAGDPTSPFRLWTATFRGAVHASVDDGVTWRTTGRLPAGWPLVGLARRRRGTALIAAEGRRLARSTDGGRTWRRLRAAGLPDVEWFDGRASTDGDGRGLVLRADGRLFRLAAGARRWATWSQGLPAGVDDLAVRADGSVLVVAGDRLWLRRPGAARFVQVADGPQRPGRLLRLRSGVLVAGIGGIAILEDA